MEFKTIDTILKNTLDTYTKDLKMDYSINFVYELYGDGFEEYLEDMILNESFYSVLADYFNDTLIPDNGLSDLEYLGEVLTKTPECFEYLDYNPFFEISKEKDFLKACIDINYQACEIELNNYKYFKEIFNILMLKFSFSSEYAFSEMTNISKKDFIKKNNIFYKK